MDATDPRKLFSVEGMVVCITGGGTGTSIRKTPSRAATEFEKQQVLA